MTLFRVRIRGEFETEIESTDRWNAMDKVMSDFVEGDFTYCVVEEISEVKA